MIKIKRRHIRKLGGYILLPFTAMGLIVVMGITTVYAVTQARKELEKLRDDKRIRDLHKSGQKGETW